MIDVRQAVIDLSADDVEEQQAARRLFESDGAALRPDLLALLRSPDPEIVGLRWEIGHALWLSPDRAQALPALVELLSEPDICWMAADYVEYLDGMNHPGVLEALGRPDPDIRHAAAYLLQRADARAIPALAALLSDPVPRLRLAAIKALARIGHRAGIEPLRRALGDPAAGIRVAAGWALRRIESGRQ